jgi:hypothetical protein
MHRMCMEAPPLRQQELQDGCVILAQNPRSTNLHFRPVVVILPAPSYHHHWLLLLTGQTILPTWLLAQLSPSPRLRSIAQPPPTWPTECTILSSVHLMSRALLRGERPRWWCDCPPPRSQQPPSGSSWSSGCCQQLGG